MFITACLLAFNVIRITLRSLSFWYSLLRNLFWNVYIDCYVRLPKWKSFKVCKCLEIFLFNLYLLHYITGPECSLACTMDYRPLCVHDKSTNPASLHTISNMCMLKQQKYCEGKTLELLYSGECEASRLKWFSAFKKKKNWVKE